MIYYKLQTRKSIMNQNTHQRAREVLVDTKLKQTKGRIATLVILLKAKNPLTIEDIQSRSTDEVHFVTLYRMLKQFVDVGIVYQTDLRKGKAYYELQNSHHHHITCTTCGTQEEITSCLNDVQKKALQQSRQFKGIHSHMLEFFSVCMACDNK